jgi:hypothetical protein
LLTRELFIVSLVVITLSGVAGYLLYKLGSNSLGVITFERLAEADLTGRSLAYLAVMLLGFLLVAYGGYELRSHIFAMRYLFTPAIFAGLVLLFVSRFLIGIPLSVTGVGKLTAVLTVLLVLGTAAASSIVFKESYSLRVVAGMALAALSILLIGEV